MKNVYDNKTKIGKWNKYNENDNLPMYAKKEIILGAFFNSYKFINIINVKIVTILLKKNSMFLWNCIKKTDISKKRQNNNISLLFKKVKFVKSL